MKHSGSGRYEPRKAARKRPNFGEEPMEGGVAIRRLPGDSLEFAPVIAVIHKNIIVSIYSMSSDDYWVAIFAPGELATTGQSCEDTGAGRKRTDGSVQ